MWPFKILPGAKDIRDVVTDAAKKSRRNRWDDVKEIATELSGKYDTVIEARSKFREARLTLEDLEAQTKVAQVSGQKAPDLDQAKEAVEKTRILLQALEDQLRITERRAKQKYPDVFRFL